jgi:putative heme-binding domain-containing protein
MVVLWWGLLPLGAIADRPAWTTSRVVGTPEPPLPFRTERVWPTLAFQQPTLLAFDPTDRWVYVGEQGGKLWAFERHAAEPNKRLVVDLAASTEFPAGTTFDALYGLAFDSDFARNRQIYLCYVLKPPRDQVLPDGSRVSRFTLSAIDPPVLDRSTETIVYTYRAGGHNGGCLEFGPDGYLYLGTGDAAGPNPPDALRTGQDCSDDLSSILRIDVHRTSEGRPYTVPADNPFVGRAGIRPEIWAYGLRNPWKMTFDRRTGELWVADVGWDQWELVHWVTKGANFGWAAMEGPQPILPDVETGPSPVQPPLIALPHAIAASVTGGYVYRGAKFPELQGKYVFGDWETKRLWTAERDRAGQGILQDLADSGLQVVAFGQDAAGELWLIDYGQGVIHELARNPVAATPSAFPGKLSETGLFVDVATQQPATGVFPFEINQPQWSDHATGDHWIALPGSEPIVWHPGDRPIPGSMFSRQHDYPAGTVLVKTLSLELVHGDPASARKLETQLLHYDGQQWRGYSYAWNDEQTDAELVPATGAERVLSVRDARLPEGVRPQRWQYASRLQCLSCHTPWAQHALAFTPAQLHRPIQREGRDVEQLAWLEAQGLWRRVDGEQRPLAAFTATSLAEVPRFARHDDPAADTESHVRSYLHVHCSHCHRFNGGGAGSFELLFERSLAELQVLDAAPRQGTLDVPGARIIAPGRPELSLLYLRMAKFGRGRMPHLGSELVDEQALGWMERWIRNLPATTQEAASVDESLARRLSEALSQARRVGRGESSDTERESVLAAAAVDPHPLIPDFFTGYQPASRRRQTLGTVIDPEAILSLTGDAIRGERLFQHTAGVQCKTCHRLDGHAGVGPDLRKLPERRTRRDLLESLLQPSKRIEPAYVTRLALTEDGRVISGLMVAETADSLTLRDGQGRETTLSRIELESLEASPTSLMPEGLLRDMTTQEAADLLSYLERVAAGPE